MESIPHKILVRRALEVWRNEGTAAALERTLARLGRCIFRTNSAVWFGRDLTSFFHAGTSRDHEADASGARVRVVPAPGAEAPLVHVPQTGVPGTPARERNVPGSLVTIEPMELAQWLWSTNDLAWAADTRELEVASRHSHSWISWRIDSEIVAFCKVGGSRVFVEDFDRALDLPGGIALISDVYVTAHMRRKGIARELLLATMSHLKEKSFCGVACHIPASNEPSIRLFKSVGFESLGKIRFTRLLGMPIFSRRPEDLLKRFAAMSGQ